VFSDVGVSGDLPVDERLGLLGALQALREHNAGVLLFAKRDRLARDIAAAVAVEHLAERNGARMMTTEGDHGDDPNAWLLRTIKDVLAQYELLQIRARTKAALAIKRARGENTGGALPYGYQLGHDGIHLEPDLGEQHIISVVCRLRSCGCPSEQSVGSSLPSGMRRGLAGCGTR
jgi:DNA invertase Pin-like site-specific DNA recombinase